MSEDPKATKPTPRAEPKPRVLIVTCTEEIAQAVQAAANEAELPAPDFLYGLMAYQRITGRRVLN